MEIENAEIYWEIGGADLSVVTENLIEPRTILNIVMKKNKISTNIKHKTLSPLPSQKITA